MRANIRLDAHGTTNGLLCEMKRVEQQLADQHAASERTLILVVCLGLMLLAYAVSFWPAWGWVLSDVRFRWFLYGVGSTVLCVVAAILVGVCIGVTRIKEHPSV